MIHQTSSPNFNHLPTVSMIDSVETSTPINNPQLGSDSDPIDSTAVASNGHTGWNNPENHSNAEENESYLIHKGNEVPQIEVSEPSLSYYTVTDKNQEPSGPIRRRNSKVSFSPTKEVVSFLGEEKPGFKVDLILLESEDEDGNRRENNTERGSWKHRGKSWGHFFLDPQTPHVLSLYLQLFFNAVLVLIVLYLLYFFIETVRDDIRNKIEMYTSDALREISLCSREYYRNRCTNEDGSKRAPALEKTCVAWEKCMNRDPQQMGRSQITAETFGDIVNGFLHPISWKSTILFSSLVIGAIFITNVAFGSYRSRLGYEQSVSRERIAEMEEYLKRQIEAVKSRELLSEIRTPPVSSIAEEQHYDPIDESAVSLSSPLTRRGLKRSV